MIFNLRAEIYMIFADFSKEMVEKEGLITSIINYNGSGGSRISPRRGGQLPGGGAPTYDFAKISQKLHEIERIWTRGGARPQFYYVDPQLNGIQIYGPHRKS